MHLVVVTNLYPPEVLGGYELLAQDIVEGLRSRGHTVRVLTSGKGGSEAGEARILRLSRPFDEAARRDRIRHLLAAVHNGRATRRTLEQGGVPDATLVMSLRRIGLEPMRVLQRMGVPAVWTVNDDWPVAYAVRGGETVRGRIAALVDRGRFWKHTWRGVRVARVVYLSQAIRSEVRSAVCEFPAGRVCNQGVNRKLFSPRSFRAIGPAPRMLFVGRLHPTKAPEVAIDALGQLRRRGVQARLQVAGAPVSASYQDQLREHARRLGVADWIEWLGMVDRAELARIYRSSDLLLFLSRWEEPQGLTHMEAMASGVPVVAYPLGGAKELLDAHDVSARASACTGDAVAEAVIELMGDPDRQRGIVAAGLDLVSREASLDHYIDVLTAELECAIRESRERDEQRDSGGNGQNRAPGWRGPQAEPVPQFKATPSGKNHRHVQTSRRL